MMGQFTLGADYKGTRTNQVLKPANPEEHIT
jgi:hypothetical protein